jgi:hypothetical protein
VLSAGGGWVNGDAEFVGENPPTDAIITYFLQKRHIFGDMKLEVRDSAGKLVATLPTSKRRGLSRVAWSMTMPPPRIPPAAVAGFGVGPRFLPGPYTVKLIDGDNEYATTLRVVRDARVTHTLADRKAQFELSLKLYAMLNEMTALVDRMNSVRGQLEARGAGVAETDSLVARLRKASDAVDEMRKTIVATKEGGMVTGEERLREHLVQLYGSVTNFEGRPSQMQVSRGTSIGRELGDVTRQFNGWLSTDLGPINTLLTSRKMKPIEVFVP